MALWSICSCWRIKRSTSTQQDYANWRKLIWVGCLSNKTSSIFWQWPARPTTDDWSILGTIACFSQKNKHILLFSSPPSTKMFQELCLQVMLFQKNSETSSQPTLSEILLSPTVKAWTTLWDTCSSIKCHLNRLSGSWLVWSKIVCQTITSKISQRYLFWTVYLRNFLNILYLSSEIYWWKPAWTQAPFWCLGWFVYFRKTSSTVFQHIS